MGDPLLNASKYAVMMRRCNTRIWGAGLFGHDGTMLGQDGLDNFSEALKDELGQDGLPLKTTVSSSQTIQKFRAKWCFRKKSRKKGRNQPKKGKNDQNWPFFDPK